MNRKIKIIYASLLSVVLIGIIPFQSVFAQGDDRRSSPATLEEVENENPEVMSETDQEPVPQIVKKKDRIDPQFRQGSRYIEHPNAAKGLIKIDRDKVYHYKVKTSEQKSSASVQIADYEPSNLTNPENDAISYDVIYDADASPMLLYSQENQIFQKFGKLGWTWGVGFFLAQGNGQFETNTEEEPLEEFMLFVFPLSVGAKLQLKFFDNQFIVPYAEGGFDGFCFAEHRDDDQNPPLGAALGFAPMAHFSGGLSLMLGKGPESFLDLDREYGINAVFLNVEFRQYVALGKYDFSGDALSGGITFEY